MRRITLSVLVGGMFAFAFGCAITDYDGRTDDRTVAEAKLFGKEVAFTGFGPDVDGTYSYTVKYDNRGERGPVVISSYRNAGIVSFTRDGLVDMDGDDLQGSAGTAGGKFLPYFVWQDDAPGCQFEANKEKLNKSKGAGPGVLLCIEGSMEEIDKDFLLTTGAVPFESLDDLLKGIWSGALNSTFTAELNGVQLNGADVPVESFSVNLAHNGFRPTSVHLDFSQPAGQTLIQTILDNTVDGEPYTIGLQFEGGLNFGLPVGVTVAFNHAALSAALQ